MSRLWLKTSNFTTSSIDTPINVCQPSMTIQYVLVPAFTKQCWLSFDKVKDSSTFFSNNLIISPTQDLCDCKLLRAAGNGIPFAAMIRASRCHVTWTSDMGLFLSSDGRKEHSTTAVRVNQFYVSFYLILRILLPTTFRHKKLLWDKIRTVHGPRPP